MKKAEKNRLIATNAAVWVAGILASFVLPMIAESLTEGPGRFLKVMMFAFPLFVAMLFSNLLLSKAIGEPTD